MVDLKGKHAQALADKAIKVLQPIKQRLLTLTFDKDLEFAEHERMSKTLALDDDIYFARPYASWERGINENTNGLIRQYFPKGTDFTKVSDQQV